MTSFSGKDIDRVCRATGMSRARAESLLRRYDGRPDRVLEEACGVVRVYVAPESAVERESVWRASWRGFTGFCGDARKWLARAGWRLAALSGLLVKCPR